MTRARRALVAFAMAALVSVVGARASAEASRVVIVRARGADALVARTEVRLAAELRAAGFVVEERAVDSATDARRVVDDETNDGAFATILLQRAGNGTATDIWVADHVTKKTVVRRIGGGAGDGAERVLAMRVVELMRASLVEPLVLPPPNEAPAPTAPPSDVATWALVERPATAPPGSDRTSVAIGAGVAALYASSSLGFSWAPSLDVDFAVCSICRARALVLGPAFGARVDGSQGSATVRQELAILELAIEPSLGVRWMRPFVALGGGVYHLDARGSARAPFVDAHGDAWAAIASGGAGVRLRLSGAASFALGARALVAFPRPVVAFASDTAASAGRPSILGTLALEVDL